MGGRGLELVLSAAHHSPFARHHCLEPVFCHIGGIVFLVGPDFGIEHVGPAEKLCFGRAWHEAGQADRAGGINLRREPELSGATVAVAGHAALTG
jgi:hypothetical protein